MADIFIVGLQRAFSNILRESNMPFIVPQDVEELVVNQVASGRYRSGDEVLRSAMQALAQVDEDLVAIQDAVKEWHQGDDGIPLDDAFKKIRESRPQGRRELAS
ncbi:MAG: type II toxin-antitoxin system ParD family antitoxin [Schlesneria sp.]